MEPLLVDLDPDSRRALEFDAVLEVVASHAVTEEGARRMAALNPLRDEAAARAHLAAVEETGREIGARGRLLPGRLADPLVALGALAVEGARASTVALRDLALVLLAAADGRARLASLPERESPRLRSLGRGLPDLRREARAIVDHVEPEGRITDDASAELKRLRAAVARTAEAIRRRLESFLREPGSGGVIRDEFVTQRNGRFVIPVRGDSPRPVRGIVHAASSSGATLFVEPLETVETNNALIQLREQEQEEQERVVQGWMAALRARLEEVRLAVEGVLELDSLQARALFARDAGAVTPVVAEGNDLDLEGVRHPLLDRRLREEGVRSVPFDLRLKPPDRVLVVSGPNAGGKTVALKTVGLAALMAQSGIPVTACRARLPLFRQVRADIGDHQSIEADLSTFSAHVREVSSVLRTLEPPALLLFDEIGTGTEPSEGAALAQAVLERLRRPGVTAVATTHQGALKAWAMTAEGARSAAMEFDTETLRPTFRLILGSAGVSAGIEVAERHGLDPDVVGRAREILGGEGRKAEAYLSRLHELLREVEERRDELERLQTEMAGERDRERRQMEAEVARLRAAAREGLEEVVRDFREVARKELEALRDRAERARLERRLLRTEARLHGERERRAKDHVARAIGREEDPAPEVPREQIQPGLRVRIRSLDREGEIVRVRGSRVEVRLGTVTFTVDRSDVVAAEGRPHGDAGLPSPTRVPARPLEAAREGADLRGEGSRELLLLGRTVEEALEEVDRFLDRAALEGVSEVRVVHGHGTGRLKAAVRSHLKGHPHAASHRPGEPREGGDGATVVILK